MKYKGFTLAELLIALVILGVIATFTIPKVLQSQADEKKKAVAREVAGMFYGAYTEYQKTNTVTAATSISHLTPYMNYVRIESVTPVDDLPGVGQWSCSSAGHACLILHNGANLGYRPGANGSFGSTASTSAIFINVDPDGTYSGSTSGSGKAVQILIYPNGRMTSWANILSNTYTAIDGPWSPNAADDPSWFNWN